MNKALEIQLIGELAQLAEEKRCFTRGQATTNAVSKYLDEAHFRRERESVLRASPQIAAHAGELPEPDSFLRRRLAGLPVLLTRDDRGQVHAFLNVCRHRGTRLVDEERGCRGRFSCPYHAWTWNNRGELLKIPFGDQGFPGLDPATLGLRRLPCEERFGWIWLSPDGSELNLDEQLGELREDFAWMNAESLEIKAVNATERRANWKTLIEGGIEAYHFRIVHRNTIGPHFPANLSSYRSFGDHLRSILPRAGIEGKGAQALEGSSIRDHANVLYSIFPVSQLLLMPDHLVWVHIEPLSAGCSEVRIHTLAAADSDDDAHWQRNHDIAVATLTEDGEVAESIQDVMDAGANEVFNHGRFESALAFFNAAVDRRLAADQPPCQTLISSS